MFKRLKIYLFFIVILFLKADIFSQISDNPFKVYIHTERLLFASGNPVKFSISIKNVSDLPQKINIYGADYTTFQFIVYNRQGKEAEVIVPFRQRNQNVVDVAKSSNARAVIIESGETISKEVDLNRYYNLKEDLSYKVRGFFMPDAVVPQVLQSENTIYFRIKSDKKSGAKDEDPLIGYKKGISPSEIVTLFLNAEKKEDNKNYIKYIKLEKYINSFSDFSVAYNNSDDVYRKKILKDFVKFLITPRHDYIVDFRVKKQIIYKNKRKAEVEALVIRKGIRMDYAYKYQYNLEKYRDYWLITNVNASVSRERIEND